MTQELSTPSREDIEMLLRLFSSGRLAEAELAARELTRRLPEHGFGWKVLGSVLGAAKRTDQAMPVLQKALALLPEDPEVLNALGAAYSDARRPTDAERMLMGALALNPGYHEAWCNLANALIALGRLEAAGESCRRALAIASQSFVAHNTLGFVLMAQGKPVEAEACYRRAIELNSAFQPAWRNLGVALMTRGRLPEAETCFRHVLGMNAADCESLCNLGTVLQHLGRLREAESILRQALAVDPGSEVAHNNLGNVLRLFGRFTEASACYRQAIAIAPQWHGPHNNLGSAVMDLGQLDEAEAGFRKAMQLAPDDPTARSNLLFLLNYRSDRSPRQVFEEYRQFDEVFGLPLRSQWRPHSNDRSPGKRLRVGYSSPDFRKHSSRHYVEPMLASHDPARIELFAYADVHQEDESTARLRAFVSNWVPTAGMTDAELAERVRDDNIDILVDLAGHTQGNRLLVFARKPAPIQVSMLGFGYTTGLSAIDWYLTHPVCAPPGSEPLFAEGIWRLAPCMVYRPEEGMGDPGPLPALARGHVMFGTLSRAIRLSPATIRAWAQILLRVPGSRLCIDSGSMQNRELSNSISAQFDAHGVAADRLDLGAHSPPWNVLRGTDITLDCFPHNSGTTLYESLYMGVPVISLAGRPSVGRLGASILTSLGRTEWIAESPADYVDKAVALATDLATLAAIRGRLRAEMRQSCLMDEEAFGNLLDAAYREMWQRWCST